MKIKILYEDANILVIDKPSGISVHPDGKNKEKTITDWALKHYPKMENVGEPLEVKSLKSKVESSITIPRPGVVHRLDKQTSGVLILAKTSKAHALLKEQFQNRTIKKIYHAIVSGYVKNDKGVVDKPIGRSPTDFRRRLAGRGARGAMRDAVTEYKVLKRFISPPAKGEWPRAEGVHGEGDKFTYLEVKPKTGRTHQIRVHMKFLNHPVVCDSLYDEGGVCPPGIDRLALHAYQIEFKDIKGKTHFVESKLPKEWASIV